MTSGKTNRLVFFGTEDFSLVALRALVEDGFDIAAVITKPDTVRGRGHKIIQPKVKIYAKSQNIPVWQPEKLGDIADDIKNITPVAGILVSYGKIIPEVIIDLFPRGIINLHPSLLPKYRGPSPIESAILHGDDETGVSIMSLSAKMDAGPIYTQEKIRLRGQETKPALYDKLGEIGTAKLLADLPQILAGSAKSLPQDETKATYCELLTKSDGVLDPKKDTAAKAEQKVRAYLGFPKTRLEILDEQRIVTAAHVEDKPKTALDVEFQDGKFLIVDQLVAPSGKTVTAEEFLRGYAK